MKSTPFVYNYIEKKDLDEYLDNPINIEIFEDYKKDNNWGYSSPLSQSERERALNYLNSVYYKYDFFLNYIDNYEEIQSGFISPVVVRLKHIILLVEKNKIQLSEIGEKSLNFLRNHPDVNLSPSQAAEIFKFIWKSYDIISLPDTAEKLKQALIFKSELKQRFIYNEYDIADILFEVDTEIEKLKELITLGLLVETNTSTVDNKKPNQLQTELTDIQRGKLFDLLVSNGFIPSTDREGFIWAFGGKNDNYSSYSTEWLKKDNLAVYMVDCLCFDENVKIQDSYLNRMGKIFGIKNPRQTKKGYENNKNGTPDGYVLIDTIISEAQK